MDTVRASAVPRWFHPLRSWRPLPADVVALVTTLAVLGPALAPGYVLLRDMVFVPDPAWTWRLLGLSGETTRAVPSDLLVAVLTSVLPGDVVQKSLLLATLLLAGSGAARLVVVGRGRSVLGGSAAAIAAIWNPWVGERLLMGHWALLMGYAAVPWVARGMARRLEQGGHWLPLAIAVMLGSLGGASAQVLLAITMLAVVVVARWSSIRWGTLLRRAAPPGALFFALSIPWLVPALLSPSLASDPAGFLAFAPRADTPLGRVLSVISGGGIWNAHAVVHGRYSLPGAIGGLVFVCLGIAGLTVTLWKRGEATKGLGWATSSHGSVRLTQGLAPIALAGVLGLLFALAGILLAAGPAMAQSVALMPGGGLLRDSTRQAGPWLMSVAVGIGVLVECLRRRGVPELAAFVPAAAIVALPLLAGGVSGQLQTTRYPQSIAAVRAYLAAAPDRQAVVILPWHSNRSYAWNDGRSSLTPWSRLISREVIENSDLRLSTSDGTMVVRGENKRADDIRAALEERVPVRAMADLGVGWVVIDAPQEMPPDGAQLVVSGRDVRLFRLSSSVTEHSADMSRVIVVLGADALALLGVCAMVRHATRRT